MSEWVDKELPEGIHVLVKDYHQGLVRAKLMKCANHQWICECDLGASSVRLRLDEVEMEDSEVKETIDLAVDGIIADMAKDAGFECGLL